MKVQGPYQYVVGSLCCTTQPNCTLLSAPAQYKITGLTGITDTGFDCGDCEDFNVDPLFLSFVGNQYSFLSGDGGERCIWEDPSDPPCGDVSPPPAIFAALSASRLSPPNQAFVDITFQLGPHSTGELCSYHAQIENWDPLSTTTLNLLNIFKSAHCDDEPSSVTLQPA